MSYVNAMTTNETQKPPHRDWHGAHHPWLYRANTFRWMGEHISGINFIPLAQELRAWLMQSGQLAVLSEADRQKSGGYTNPYTYSATSLVLVLSRAVNASHGYATEPPLDHTETDVEIERLRLYNEVLLYAARVSEALIKQLLYCTHIPESQYKDKALGQLLEAPCPSCKKQNGKVPHSVSLVGTLAHPFGLCLEFEHCAMDHMDLVNKLRNSQAAHSGIQAINIRSVKESAAQLLDDTNEVLSGFVHMLSHLQKLEERMLQDLIEKGNAINLLKLNGLSPEDCNFRLIPGERFVFERPA